MSAVHLHLKAVGIIRLRLRRATLYNKWYHTGGDAEKGWTVGMGLQTVVEEAKVHHDLAH